MRPVNMDEIKGLECKHAVYCKDRYNSGDDLLMVKEVIHTKDGRTIPNLTFIENYKKDFYITKEGFRKKDAQKKEWEDISKLQKFTTNQARLPKAIARALGNPAMKGNLRRIARSPFLYGSDITTPTLIKHKYQTKFPNISSANRVAVLDIETDVVHGHERPIYVCISFKDKVVLCVTKEFVGTMVNPIEKLHQKAEELLGEHIKERGIDLEIRLCENSGEACAYAIHRAHQWQPDFLTIWNIDFDIPRVVKALEEFGYDPAEVFSDPKVPKKYRFFKYKQGQMQKKTASGMVSSIHPADRWHVAECPASFFLIDSMCVYKKIRVAGKNETSYSLDHLLDQHLGIRKLKFKETDHLSGLDWHIEMQTKYKVEYGIYNIFDCIGVELFDEKVKDLELSISVLSGYSEYTIFNSQPKRLVDQLNFTIQEKGKIIATVSDQMVDNLDSLVCSMNGWVITLPSHLTINNGLPILKELPDVRSMVYIHVADLDVSAAYPSTEVFLNISKETTFRELSAIRGVSEETKRFATINLSASHVNAVEIAVDIFKAPTLDTLLEEFNKVI